MNTNRCAPSLSYPVVRIQSSWILILCVWFPRRPGLLHRENRQALFGTNSGRNSPLPTHYAADRTAQDLEGQNDDYLKGLSSKVKLLKDVS